MPINNNHNVLSTSSSYNYSSSSTTTTNTISNNTFDTTTSTTTSTTSSSPTSSPAAMVQQQEALKCPRCDSSHTKFCYYNNYSLSQPRHFCKACKRYWTRGGTLRSVPVGGGCRKNNKRVKKATPTTAAAASSSTSNIPHNSSLVASPLTATTTTDHLNSLFYGLLPSAAVASNMNLAGASGFPTLLPQMYDQLQPQMSALGIGFSSGRRRDEEGSQLGFGASSSLADLQQTGSSFLTNYQPSVNILEAGGSFDLPKQVKVEGENNVVRSNNSDGIEWQDQAAPDMNAGDSSYPYWSSAIFGGAGWPDIANSSIAPII